MFKFGKSKQSKVGGRRSRVARPQLWSGGGSFFNLPSYKKRIFHFTQSKHEMIFWMMTLINSTTLGCSIQHKSGKFSYSTLVMPQYRLEHCLLAWVSPVPRWHLLKKCTQKNCPNLTRRAGEFYLQYDWGCYSKEMTDVEIAHRYTPSSEGIYLPRYMSYMYIACINGHHRFFNKFVT